MPPTPPVKKPLVHLAIDQAQLGMSLEGMGGAEKTQLLTKLIAEVVMQVVGQIALIAPEIGIQESIKASGRNSADTTSAVDEEVKQALSDSFTDTRFRAIISALMASSEGEHGHSLAKHISDLQSQATFGAESKRPLPYPHENVVFHAAQLQAEALGKQGTKKGSDKPYEVVDTLRDAAKRTGLAHDEILTTREIEAEYHINKKLIHEYTQRGRRGRPHLTPLDIRLAGGGGGQLLFRREDIESLVANPPKPGRTPK
jgi:hypothetical protein